MARYIAPVIEMPHFVNHNFDLGCFEVLEVDWTRKKVLCALYSPGSWVLPKARAVWYGFHEVQAACGPDMVSTTF